MNRDEKRALDVLNAEKWMGWRRQWLEEKALNFANLAQGKTPIYSVVGKAQYLLPPLKDGLNGIPAGYTVREQLGELRIGGDLQHYSENDINALQLAQAMCDAGRVVILKLDGLREDTKNTVLVDRLDKRFDRNSLALAISEMAAEA